MLLSLLIGAAAACSVFPALLFCINLRRFRPPPPADLSGPPPSISVLIPARNEEANIGPALDHVLASRNADLEILVLDDGSTDRTPDIVRTYAALDPRLHLVPGRPLPHGWNGKQFACWTLAQESTRPLLVFLDADVRIHPDLLARTAAFRARTGTALVSGFPRLITITFLEKLLLPLIHFILLAFLPMRSMRRTTRPAVAAGCGQFFLADRAAYFAAGGHNALRETMHDGLLLPRTLRRAGYKTDIADITSLAEVRMYDSATKVWSGLAKNATEGIATPAKIAPLSAILFLGQVLPALFGAYVLGLGLLLLVLHLTGNTALESLMELGFSPLATLFFASHGGFITVYKHHVPAITGLLFFAILSSYLPRLLATRRFQQPPTSALLHPIGVLVLLIVQWYALTRKVFGKPVGWRQRTYSSQTGTELGS